MLTKRKIYKPILFSSFMMKKRIPRKSVLLGKEKTDFSHQAVLIMLLLLVIVSIVSIGIYLHTLDNIKPKFVVNEGKAAGEVAIVITKAPSELEARRNSPSTNNLNSQS